MLLFFSRNEKVTALQSYLFLSICEEIQTWFFADGSEVVILVVRRKFFKYISRLYGLGLVTYVRLSWVRLG